LLSPRAPGVFTVARLTTSSSEISALWRGLMRSASALVRGERVRGRLAKWWKCAGRRLWPRPRCCAQGFGRGWLAGRTGFLPLRASPSVAGADSCGGAWSPRLGRGDPFYAFLLVRSMHEFDQDQAEEHMLICTECGLGSSRGAEGWRGMASLPRRRRRDPGVLPGLFGAGVRRRLSLCWA
jgi:hypothetical protein